MKIIAVSAASLATLMLVNACATTNATSAAAVASPVSVTNCGQSVAVASPPKRALSMEQNATEILLSLGLADRMIGTSYQTDPVLPALRSEYAKVPVLAKLYPSREAVRGARPDFVYSTFTSAYATDAAGPRAELRKVGVSAYLSRFACEKPADGQPVVDFDGLFAEITEVAGLFGVRERGAELVASQQRRLDAAAAADRRSTSVLWYYSGTSTPYVAGAGGMPAAISTVLGLQNVYGDASQTWPAGSWERIAQLNPDVIVVADLTRGGDGDSARSKIDFLRSNPTTSKLDAVKAGRFVTVAGSSMDPGIRSVGAVEQVSAGLAELGR